MKKELFLKAIIFSFLVLLVSCSDMFTNKKSFETQNDEKAYVIVSDKSTVARMAQKTISPSAELSDLTGFSLTAKKTKFPDSATINSPESETLASAGKFDDLPSSIEVEPGTWTFTLTAELDEISFTSTLTDIVIAKGSTTPLSFTLAPESETKGGLDLKVTFPKEAAKVHVDFNKQGESTKIIDQDYTAADSTFQIKTDPYNTNKRYIEIQRAISNSSLALNPGAYNLTLYFYDSELTEYLNKTSVTVNISAGITTSSQFELPDLNAVYSINYHTYTTENEPLKSESITETGTEILKYSRNTPSVTLPTLSHPGYAFDGWYDNPDFKGSAITSWAANEKTGDLELYAKWSVNFYAFIGETFYSNKEDTISAIQGLTIPAEETRVDVILTGSVLQSELGSSETADTILYNIKEINTADTSTKLQFYFSVLPGQKITLSGDCTNFFKEMSLISIDCSGLDTSGVTDMSGMFDCNTKLQSLNLSGFNTSSVTNMDMMFSDCWELEDLDCSSFNTAGVTSMSGMFQGCMTITSLDLTNFYTSAVTDMSNMFFNCSELTTITVTPYFTVKKVSNSNNMFQGSENLLGRKGTAYNSEKTDKEYARVDRTGIQGYFTQTTFIGPKDAPTEVGDVVFNDGSAISRSALSTMTDEQRNAAIAVIFYVGENCNNEGETDSRVLGVGFHHVNMALCSSSAKFTTTVIQTTTQIGSIETTVTGSAGNYTFSGIKNGSQILATAGAWLDAMSLNNDTGTTENYPGFYWAINYKDQKINAETAGRIISGSYLEDGWYVPCIAELYEIYQVKDDLDTIVNDACNIWDSVFGDGNAYFSSSQYPDNKAASYLNFGTGSWDGIGWSNANKYICAIRQFN